MINFQEEINRFKPSLDVDHIEDAISGMDLTDMNDLMMQLIENAGELNELKRINRFRGNVSAGDNTDSTDFTGVELPDEI